jgi:hypothetical protein
MFEEVNHREEWEAKADREIARIIVEHPEVEELLNVFKAPEPKIRDHKRYRKIRIDE